MRRQEIQTVPDTRPRDEEQPSRWPGVLHALWLAFLLVAFVAVAATAVATTAAPSHAIVP